MANTLITEANTEGKEGENDDDSSQETGKEQVVIKTEETQEESGQEPTSEKESDGKSDDDKEEKAPENYDDFTMPEGVELDTELLDKFVPLAKDLDLSQDKAQKMVDMYIEAQTQQTEAVTKAWTDTVEGWANDAKKDSEFGGVNFEANLGTASSTLKAFGSPELSEALDYSGMGNHPEMIRFFFKVGKLLGENDLINGDKPVVPKDVARSLYPTMDK